MIASRLPRAGRITATGGGSVTRRGLFARLGPDTCRRIHARGATAAGRTTRRIACGRAVAGRRAGARLVGRAGKSTRACWTSFARWESRARLVLFTRRRAGTSLRSFAGWLPCTSSTSAATRPRAARGCAGTCWRTIARLRSRARRDTVTRIRAFARRRSSACLRAGAGWPAIAGLGFTGWVSGHGGEDAIGIPVACRPPIAGWRAIAGRRVARHRPGTGCAIVAGRRAIARCRLASQGAVTSCRALTGSAAIACRLAGHGCLNSTDGVFRLRLNGCGLTLRGSGIRNHRTPAILLVETFD